MCFYTTRCRKGIFRRVDFWDSRSRLLSCRRLKYNSIALNGRYSTPVYHNVNLNPYGQMSPIRRQPFCPKAPSGATVPPQIRAPPPRFECPEIDSVEPTFGWSCAPILNLTGVNCFNSVITRPPFKCKRKIIPPSTDAECVRART